MQRRLVYLPTHSSGSMHSGFSTRKSTQHYRQKSHLQERQLHGALIHHPRLPGQHCAASFGITGSALSFSRPAPGSTFSARYLRRFTFKLFYHCYSIGLSPICAKAKVSCWRFHFGLLSPQQQQVTFQHSRSGGGLPIYCEPLC